MELCNKKRDDGIWMDEVAALQAYSPSEFSYFGRSGIMLAAEHSDVTQDIMMNNQNIGLSSRKQNGSIDASTSDTISHGSLDTNLGTRLYFQNLYCLLVCFTCNFFVNNFHDDFFQPCLP